MEEPENSDSQRTTEWALLFPLRTGLLSLKSSFNSLAEFDNQNSEIENLNRIEYSSQQNISTTRMASGNNSARSSIENLATASRLRNRRRSSMSDLDKIGGLKGGKISGMKRSPTSHSYDYEYNSTPNSPRARLTHNLMQSENVRGSIGDFMNFKRFGGGSGARTETLIAKTVPLTTVTKKTKESNDSNENNVEEEEDACTSSKISLSETSTPKSKAENSTESGDEIKSGRVRKTGVAFSENILIQHFVKTFSNDSDSNDKSEKDIDESRGDVTESSQSLNCPSSSVPFNTFTSGNESDPNHNEVNKESGVPLSGSQRTERLSRIIKQQHSTHQLYANIPVSVKVIVYYSMF